MFEALFQTFEEPESGVALTRAAVGLSRGTGAAEADRIRGSPRRSAAKRICRAFGRAAGLADRLHRIGRPGDRADAGGRGVRRRPLYAAGGKAGRYQGLEHRAAGRSAARKAGWRSISPPATASDLIRGCTLPRQPNGWLRPAPRPARNWSRSTPTRLIRCGPSARRRRLARSPFTARNFPAKRKPTSSGGSGWRSQDSAPTRWCCRIRTRWRGPSTSAAPTSRIRRCRCPMRWCRRTAGPPCSSITASSPTAPATISNASADVAEPDALTPNLTELARGGASIALDSATAADALEPADHRPPAASRCAAAIPSACSRPSRTRPRSKAPGPRTGATRWRWRGSWPGSTAKPPPAR